MSAISKTPRFLAALAVEKVIGEDIFSGVVLNQVLSQTNLSGPDRALTTNCFTACCAGKLR